MRELPPTLRDFRERHPGIWESHERLSEECMKAGPLDRKTALLVKIGIAAASRKRTPLATHIRHALAEGVTAEEVEHALLLTTPTLGLSTMMQAVREWRAVQSSG